MIDALAESETNPLETSISGQRLLDEPLLNKSSAFPEDERRELGLMGLLPLHTSTIDKLEQTVSGKMWKPHYVALRRGLLKLGLETRMRKPFRSIKPTMRLLL